MNPIGSSKESTALVGVKLGEVMNLLSVNHIQD